MPKPMLNKPQTQQKTENILSATQQEPREQTQPMDKLKLDRLLRKPRSRAYMDAIHKLDAGGHVQNQNKVNDLLRTLRDEFPDVNIEKILLGVVSVCYLGAPYEVHTIEPGVGIIEHYPRGRVLPNGMERARGLVMRGGYDFVEVYLDCCRCVSEDGSVAVIPY